MNEKVENRCVTSLNEFTRRANNAFNNVNNSGGKSGTQNKDKATLYAYIRRSFGLYFPSYNKLKEIASRFNGNSFVGEHRISFG